MARKIRAGTPAISTTLTPQQQGAAHTLAFTGYVKGKRVQRGAVRMAAERAGVTRQTIYCWLDIPEFVEEIERHTNEGIYTAWSGLMLGAQEGNHAACAEILRRLMPKEDPKITLEKVKHEQRMEAMDKEQAHRLELMREKARLGIELDEEPTTFELVVTESGETPPPEHRH